MTLNYVIRSLLQIVIRHGNSNWLLRDILYAVGYQDRWSYHILHHQHILYWHLRSVHMHTSTKKISYKYYSKKTSNSRQLTQKLKEEILLNGHMSRCYCSCSYHTRYFVCSFLQLQQFDAGTILQSICFSFHLVETEILNFYCIKTPYRIVRIFG